MKFSKKGKKGIRKILEECLALLFLLKDRRVHWYTKIVVLIPLAYIASPIDLIPDGLLFFGQIDDLIVVRFSYTLLKAIVDPVAMEECRAQSHAFLSQPGENRMKYAVAFSALWIFILTFMATTYFSPLLPGLIGVLPALHIGQDSAV